MAPSDALWCVHSCRYVHCAPQETKLLRTNGLKNEDNTNEAAFSLGRQWQSHFSRMRAVEYDPQATCSTRRSSRCNEGTCESSQDLRSFFGKHRGVPVPKVKRLASSVRIAR